MLISAELFGCLGDNIESFGAERIRHCHQIQQFGLKRHFNQRAERGIARDKSARSAGDGDARTVLATAMQAFAINLLLGIYL
jgi:hypothetical protein